MQIGNSESNEIDDNFNYSIENLSNNASNKNKSRLIKSKYGFLTNKIESIEKTDDLKEFYFENLNKLNYINVCAIFCKIIKLGDLSLRNIDFFKSLKYKFINNINQFKPREMITSAKCLYKINEKIDIKVDLDFIFEKIINKINDCLAHDLADFSMLLKNVGCINKKLFEIIANKFIEKRDIFRLEPLDITNLIYSFTASGFYDKKFFDLLAASTVVIIQNFDLVGLSIVAKNFVFLKHYDPELFNSIAKHAIERISGLLLDRHIEISTIIGGLINLARAFTECGHYDKNLFNAIAQFVTVNYSEFKFHILRDFIVTFATFHHFDKEFFEKMSNSIFKSNKNNLIICCITATLLAYCIVNINYQFNDQLKSLINKALSLDNYFESSDFQVVYLYTKFVLKNSQIKWPEKVVQRENSKAEFNNLMVNEISEELKKIAQGFEINFSIENMRVDFAFPGQKVAIKVYAANDYIRNDDRLLGHLDLKERIIKAMGWKIKTISYWEWDNRDSKRRVEYLKYILGDLAKTTTLVTSEIPSVKRKRVDFLNNSKIQFRSPQKTFDKEIKQEFDLISFVKKADFLIDPKYLLKNGEREFDNVVGGFDTERSAPWLSKPTFSLSCLADKQLQSTLMSKRAPEAVVPALGLFFHTLKGKLPNWQERNTFIMLGREIQHAHIPEEVDGGRVILVISENQLELLNYLAPNRDFLVIKNREGEKPGLIARRRNSTLKFAAHCGLSHLLMIDDNLQDFYLSRSLSPTQTWKDLYDLMHEGMVSAGCSAVSLHSYNPKVQSGFPDNQKIELTAPKLSSKVFLINLKDCKKIAGELLHILWPPKMDLWGEDLFFQFSLLSNGLKIGVIDNSTAFMRRTGKGKNEFLKTNLPLAESRSNLKLQGANVWLNLKLESSAPAFHHQVYKSIKALILTSKEVWRQKQTRLEKMELKTIYLDASRSLVEKPIEYEKIEASSASKRRKLSNETKKETKIFSYTDNLSYLGNSYEILKQFAAFDIDPTCIRANGDAYFDFGAQPLRMCQISAIQSLQKALNFNKESFSGYFDMATGTGKSLIMYTLAISFLNLFSEKNNILIVGPSVDLLTQMHRKFNEFCKKYAEVSGLKTPKSIVISAGHCAGKVVERNEDWQKGGYVAFVCTASLHNHGKLLEKAPLVIFDEFHKISELVLGCISMIKKNGGIALGFSATPQSRAACFDSKIFEYSAEQAAKDGIVAPWLVGRLPTEDFKMEDFILHLGSYLETQLHPNGGTLSEKKGIIFVPNSLTINQEELPPTKAVDWVVEQLKKRKNLEKRVQGVHSYTKEKKNIIQQFRQQQASILVSYKIGREGLDDDVDYVIDLDEKMSDQDLIQTKGRALRTNQKDPKVFLSKIAYILVPKMMKLPENFEYSGKDLLLKNHKFRILEEKYDLKFDPIEKMWRPTKKKGLWISKAVREKQSGARRYKLIPVAAQNKCEAISEIIYYSCNKNEILKLAEICESQDIFLKEWSNTNKKSECTKEELINYFKENKISVIEYKYKNEESNKLAPNKKFGYTGSNPEKIISILSDAGCYYWMSRI